MTQAKNHTLAGAGFLVLSVFMFCIESAVARALNDKVPLAYLLATRALAQLLVPLPWMLAYGVKNILTTPGRKLHLVRGVLTVTCWIVFYYSAAKLPLALSTLVSFSSILWVAVLAAPLLGEAVTRKRMIAAVVGFAGIAVATHPAFDASSIAISACLLAAFLSSLIVIVMRRLSTSEPPVAIMFYMGASATLAFVPYALLHPTPIAWQYVPVLLIIVPCGPLGMWCMIRAYRLAEASAIMPVQYVRYVQAIALGWFLFGEVPDRWSLIGATIALGAALWLTWPKRRTNPVVRSPEMRRAAETRAR